MLIETTACSKKNNVLSYFKPNEDYLICDRDHNIFIIADGVTRDLENGEYPNPSPASMASDFFSNSVYNTLIQEYGKAGFIDTAPLAIKKANTELSDFNQKVDKGANGFPASTVAIVATITGSLLQLLYNGDCGCVILRNKEIIRITQPQTKAVLEHRKELTRHEIRLEIANNKNHPLAYGVYNGDEKANEFVCLVEFLLEPNDVILLYSDGCDPAINELNGITLSDLSAEELIAESEKIETSEKLRSDDKTIIRIKFSFQNGISEDYKKAKADTCINYNFQKESEAITAFIADNKLEKFVDLGCWYGLLLNKVAAMNPTVKILALDGVSEFLQITRETCIAVDRAIFYNYILLPQARSDASFTFNINDSSKSGLDSAGIPVRNTERILVKDFLALPGVKSFLTNAYLKIDLEGVDFDIVYDILNNGVLPAVIHFEMLRRTRKDEDEILNFLDKFGFKVMKAPSYDHAFHSLICSKSKALVLGFNPYQIYYGF